MHFYLKLADMKMDDRRYVGDYLEKDSQDEIQIYMMLRLKGVVSRRRFPRRTLASPRDENHKKNDLGLARNVPEHMADKDDITKLGMVVKAFMAKAETDPDWRVRCPFQRATVGELPNMVQKFKEARSGGFAD